MQAATNSSAEEEIYRKQNMNQIKPGLRRDFEMESNESPLHERLPTCDENGKLLSDLMMLIPGLRNGSGRHFRTRLAILHAVLGSHRDVVFADLNAPLNLLWVSVRARHGVITELAAEIRFRIPEARLVGHTTAGKPVTEPVYRGGKENRRRRRTRFWIRN